MNTNSYFNTNVETGLTLEKSEKKAYDQEKMILWLFSSTHKDYTPDEVYERLYAHTNVPITSVRRAMTNLTNKGRLEKTDQQRTGSYGKKVSVWRLVRRPGVQARLF